MLILHRRPGEDLVFEVPQGLIELKVLATGRGKVHLGIVAPPDVNIARKEVYTPGVHLRAKPSEKEGPTNDD